jgi:hypothetical protein
MPYFVSKTLKKIIVYISIVIAFTKCAQITPLTGGKKDTTAPKALLYFPENASTHFDKKYIEIVFDEYISLKNLSNEFIITPKTNENPDIQTNGKKLKITFSEPLLANTTYKLAFGNSIVDLRESNPISNFEYVFSTGSAIDSLKLFGSVLSAETKKPQPNVLVGLYSSNSNDSIVYKGKPFYTTYTNEKGIYQFTNLPSTPFKLITIRDNNKNKMYDGSDEEIGFIQKLITAADTIKNDVLLFKEHAAKQFVKKTISNEYGKVSIVYNKACKDITTVTLLGTNQGSYQINTLQDSIIVYYQNCYDTLKTIINRYSKNDTLLLKIPSRKEFEKLKKNNDLKYKITSNLSQSLPYYENINLRLNIPFSLENINKDKIRLYRLNDSLKTKQSYTITENENQFNTFQVKTNLEKETSYQLIINKDAFIDSTGRTNDSLSFKFTTTTPDDYAQLKLNMLFPHKENYIVLLLNDKNQVIKKRLISFSLASTNEKQITFNYIIPGLYFVKVIEDANKNDAFDTGSFFNRIQPETIFVNETPIKLLSGWEIENEWLVK